MTKRGYGKSFKVLALALLVGSHSVEAYSAKKPHSSVKKSFQKKIKKSRKKEIQTFTEAEWENALALKRDAQYIVKKGDTLPLISQKIFGTPKFWSKIWVINNDKIKNPNDLPPGTLIALASDPTSQKSSDAQRGLASVKLTRSEEWRNLPPQGWEHTEAELSSNIDSLGFDTASKIQIPTATGFEPSIIPATEKIPVLGQIFGSRSESEYLSLNDTVYIQAFDTLQVGETYAITDDPYLLKSKKSDRIGYSYLIIGAVKILGVKDNVFIGNIVTNRDFLPRGSTLIPLPAKIKDLTPVPGPKPLIGTLLLDHRTSTYTTAQNKEVFVDRGSDDGIQPGMVFRVYEHTDPSNEKTITDSDFIIDANIMITRVTPSFSSGLVMESLSPVFENSTLVLLTDVSDLNKHHSFTEKAPKKDELDELDQLDNNEPLGNDERKELQQLENWKKNSSSQSLGQSSDQPSAQPSDQSTAQSLGQPSAEPLGQPSSSEDKLNSDNSLNNSANLPPASDALPNSAPLPTEDSASNPPLPPPPPETPPAPEAPPPPEAPPVSDLPPATPDPNINPAEALPPPTPSGDAQSP